MTATNTKGIAQQLCDGSMELDEMDRVIFTTVRIIKGQFEKLQREESGRVLLVICANSYTWRVDIGTHSQVSIACRHETNVFLSEIISREVLSCVCNELNHPPMSHVKGAYDSLDEFVKNVFDNFPEFKTNLQPLLDAGK